VWGGEGEGGVVKFSGGGLKGGRYKKKGVAFGHTQTHTHQEERKII